MHSTLIVIIPIYTTNLKDWEQRALDNNLRALAQRDVCFLIPHGLDISPLQKKYPHVRTQAVSDDWLGTRRGIKGYNEMMMSAAFYDLFRAYDFMLICHLDAWLFRDDLSQWCARGYDLVAAPWPLRPRYRRFPLREYLRMKNFLLKKMGKVPRTLMYGRIGNGGLCLRRVEAFRDVCTRHAGQIARYNEVDDGMHNEDIFFALETPELKVPTVSEALAFAYDLKPAVCHHLNAGRLPMGCHGFMHKSRRAFWAKFIPCAGLRK